MRKARAPKAKLANGYSITEACEGITCEEYTLGCNGCLSLARIQLAKIYGEWHWATSHFTSEQGSGYCIHPKWKNIAATRKAAMKEAIKELLQNTAALKQHSDIERWTKTLATQKLNQQQQQLF